MAYFFTLLFSPSLISHFPPHPLKHLLAQSLFQPPNLLPHPFFPHPLANLIHIFHSLTCCVHTKSDRGEKEKSCNPFFVQLSLFRTIASFACREAVPQADVRKTSHQEVSPFTIECHLLANFSPCFFFFFFSFWPPIKRSRGD